MLLKRNLSTFVTSSCSSVLQDLSAISFHDMLFVAHWLEIGIWEPKLSLCFSKLSLLKGISFFQCSEAIMCFKFTSLDKEAALRALLLIVRTLDEMLIHFFA